MVRKARAASNTENGAKTPNWDDPAPCRPARSCESLAESVSPGAPRTRRLCGLRGQESIGSHPETGWNTARLQPPFPQPRDVGERENRARPARPARWPGGQVARWPVARWPVASPDPVGIDRAASPPPTLPPSPPRKSKGQRTKNQIIESRAAAYGTNVDAEADEGNEPRAERVDLEGRGRPAERGKNKQPPIGCGLVWNRGARQPVGEGQSARVHDPAGGDAGSARGRRGDSAGPFDVHRSSLDDDAHAYELYTFAKRACAWPSRCEAAHSTVFGNPVGRWNGRIGVGPGPMQTFGLITNPAPSSRRDSRGSAQPATRSRQAWLPSPRGFPGAILPKPEYTDPREC